MPEPMNDPRAGKVWSANLVVAMAVNICISLNFFMLIPTTVLYVTATFGATIAEAGLAAGAYLAGSVVTRLFTGAILARLGHRLPLVGGAALMTVFSALLLVPQPFEVFVLLRVCCGAAFAFAGTAVATAALSSFPPDRRGTGTGTFAMSNSIAGAIGPLLAITMSAGPGITWVFVTVTACSAAAALLSLGVRAPEPTGSLPAASRWSIASFLDVSIVPICSVVVLVGMSYAAVTSFLQPYTRELGLEAAAGGFFLVYSLVMVATRPLVGRVVDTRGPNAVMYPAILSFALALTLLATADTGWQLLIAGALSGFGVGTVTTVGQVMALAGRTGAQLGFALSTFFLFLDLSYAVGPWAVGLLLSHSGYAGGMWILLGVCGATSVLYFLVAGSGRRTAGDDQETVAVANDASTPVLQESIGVSTRSDIIDSGDRRS